MSAKFPQRNMLKYCLASPQRLLLPVLNIRTGCNSGSFFPDSPFIFNLMKSLLLFAFCIFQFQVFAQKPYQVIAYYTGDGEKIKNYPVHRLDQIIYSFLTLRNDSLQFRRENQKQILRQLVALKKDHPRLKVLVSLGGWGGCAPCSEVFASEARRRTFAKTTVALLKEYGADGLDLDWEYPAIEGYPGHRFDPSDKNNFTELVKALREEMGKDYILSFAAGGFVKFLEESVDWTQVAPLVDYINLMTYDLVNGYSKVTGHHTPLDDYKPGQESTDKCVSWLLDRGVPARKLIVGAAFYARVWKEVPDQDHGLFQSGVFERSVPFREFPSYFSDSSGFTYHWDKKSKAPWQYSPSKKSYGTFDDERSIQAKTKYVRRKKLGGMMFWELTLDKPAQGLLEAVYQGLGNNKYFRSNP